MSDLYFSMSLSNEKMLCLSSLTDKKASNIPAEVLGDGIGYFLYECCVSRDMDDVDVLARVPTEDAALRLSYLLRME